MEANGRLQRSSNKGLWPECLVQERPKNRGLWRQNGRLQRSSNKGLWPECLVQAAARDFRPFKGFKACDGRLERRNNRGLWRQTAGCNALATKACGRSAWCKQRSSNILRLQTAGLNTLTTEGYGGKRQAATLEQQRPVAGVIGASNALATKACGRSAWCKQPRGI